MPNEFQDINTCQYKDHFLLPTMSELTPFSQTSIYSSDF